VLYAGTGNNAAPPARVWRAGSASGSPWRVWPTANPLKTERIRKKLERGNQAKSKFNVDERLAFAYTSKCKNKYQVTK
jgi:hypothetical protein